MKKFTAVSLMALMSAIFATPVAAETAENCTVTGAIERSASEGQSDRITVELAGKEDGPDVILIPGLSTPRAVWDDIVRKLAGCYRLHLVQVRGFGDAPAANTQGPVLDPLVEVVADYIDDEMIDAERGKPKIIGHSFGGLAAMKVGLAIPEKTSGVMVVDSLPFLGILFGPNATAEQIEPQAKMIRSAMQSAPEPGLDDRTLRTMSKTKAGQDKVNTWVKTSDLMVAGQVFYEVMTTDIRSELKENKVPITMVYPIDPDGAFPVTMAENNYKISYASVPNATLKRIDDSAHFIMLDQPETFAAAVEEFLKN